MNQKEDSIKLKLSKSKALLAEIETLMVHKYFTTVISRLYYSCFHATKALLLTKDLIPKTHSGVISLLHQHFVQSGSFEMNHAIFYSRLMQERIDDDYSDFMIISESEVLEFIQPAYEYVAYIENTIEQYLNRID